MSTPTTYSTAGAQQVDPINGTTYQFPILGPQIGAVYDEFNMPAPTDVSAVVARDLEMVYQDEYILGFQQAIDQAWSYGINATYRKVSNAVEDVRINILPGCPGYSNFPILNPGEVNTLFCAGHRRVRNLRHRRDGYIATGSGMITGYKKPERTYKAVEFQLDRAWDDKWAFNASYLWSKSEGNIEGPVNSDTGFADTNLVQFYDHPAVNERYGVLFNDHRHQIKLRGSYAFNDIVERWRHAVLGIGRPHHRVRRALAQRQPRFRSRRVQRRRLGLALPGTVAATVHA